MRKRIFAVLATAVLATAWLVASPASAQTTPLGAAPSTNLQQLIQQDQLVTRYTAYRRVGGVRGGYGGYRHAYRRVGYGGGYRHVAYRRGVYGGRYAYGRPYYRGAYYRPYGRYYGGYYPRYGGYYGYGGAAAAGLAAGAIASQPVVTGSVVPAGSNYCAQRFRSYNPATGTYTGYDGRQHPCP
ncbi:BA14K family protein [Microvirga sp. 2MCAF38]|uniref:BA14K family protein n=1 Tax=Microvirga sp. 2MCAF38 TaxID=3232989 RepID=UPI003F9D9C3B